MPTAVCLVNDRVPYPHPQFAQGLRAAGFRVAARFGGKPRPGDVLVVWNRSGPRQTAAQGFERAGCPVIVAENGWIGRTSDGAKFYALCLGHHNGAGQWREGGEDRWPLLNVELKPWRAEGRHVVILASRGIGEPGVAQPRDWPGRIERELRRRTKRPIILRAHPGDSHALIDDAIAGAHAVVTWASGAAVKAIAAGIPAFHALPRWIAANAARPIDHDLEDPFLGDRLPMFRRLSWAQFTAAEIATGAPFQWLLKSPSTA